MAHWVNNHLIATAQSSPNIALLKYWGKQYDDMILACNPSISVTLNNNDIFTKTTVVASPDFAENELKLNDKIESFDNPRVVRVIDLCRSLCRDYKDKDGNVVVKAEDLKKWNVHITSRNNFPTAAGVASSASGYSCLVVALAALFCVEEEFEGQLTSIARQGSGSACRSLHGGFVEWICPDYAKEQSLEEMSKISVAKQVAPVEHWPNLKVFIVVVKDEKKDVGSTSGMKTTVKTSDFFRHRVDNVVPRRYEEFHQAIRDKNFHDLAELTMKDSNSLHATCLDTKPPIFYINETSKLIINVLEKANKAYGVNKFFYTFDAGANAFLFCEEENGAELMNILNHYLVIKDKTAIEELLAQDLNTTFLETIKNATPKEDAVVSSVINTRIGEGARVLPLEESLFTA